MVPPQQSESFFRIAKVRSDLPRLWTVLLVLALVSGTCKGWNFASSCSKQSACLAFTVDCDTNNGTCDPQQEMKCRVCMKWSTSSACIKNRSDRFELLCAGG